jgi:hypothetical protein
MERKEQTEIGPDPRVGDTVVDQETEKFEEATEDQGLADSRRSSPIRALRQTMYKEFVGVRMDSDGNASAGIGQLSDLVSMQKPSTGNPFGIII